MTDGSTKRRIESPPASTVNLTVVLPHFNQSHVLPRAVASVVTEHMGDIEIIIVDDGSTHDTEVVLAALERAFHPSLRVIRCPQNGGAPAAMNIGLAAARGRFVTFLAADDFVMPGCHQSMIDALERHPSAALACGEIAIISTDGAVRGTRPFAAPSWSERYLQPAMIRHRIKKTDNWICGPAAVHRTEMLRAVGGFDSDLGAFSDGFVCRVLAFTHGFVFCPGVCAAWQVAKDTFSASSILDRRECARLVAVAEEKLSASTVGRAAPDYPALFARRFRFSAARMQLVWNREDADPNVIAQAAGGARMLTAIKLGIGFGPIGRAMALCWLAVRLRPFAFRSLASNFVRNRLVFLRNRARVQKRFRELLALNREIIAEAERSTGIELAADAHVAE